MRSHRILPMVGTCCEVSLTTTRYVVNTISALRKIFISFGRRAPWNFTTEKLGTCFWASDIHTDNMVVGNITSVGPEVLLLAIRANISTVFPIPTSCARRPPNVVLFGGLREKWPNIDV